MEQSVMVDSPPGESHSQEVVGNVKDGKVTESFLVSEMCNILLAIRSSSLYKFVKEESGFKNLDFKKIKNQVNIFTDIGTQSFQIFDFLGMIRHKTLTFEEFCACLDDIYVEIYDEVLDILNSHKKTSLSLLLLEIKVKGIRNKVDLIHSIVKHLSNVMTPPIPPKSEVTGRFLSDLYNLVCEYQNLSQSSYKLEFDVCFRLFHSALRPYLRFLDTWCFLGSITDPYGEFLVYEGGGEGEQKENSERYWNAKFFIRPDSTPLFLKEYENVILTCGKSARLIKDIETEKLFQTLPLTNMFMRGSSRGGSSSGDVHHRRMSTNYRREKLEDVFLESMCKKQSPNVFPGVGDLEGSFTAPIGSVLYTSPKNPFQNEGGGEGLLSARQGMLLGSSVQKNSGRKLKLIKTTLSVQRKKKQRSNLDEERELDELVDLLQIDDVVSTSRQNRQNSEEVLSQSNTEIPFSKLVHKSLPAILIQQYTHVGKYLSKLVLFEQCKLVEHLLTLRTVFLSSRADIIDFFSRSLNAHQTIRLVDLNVILQESLEYGTIHSGMQKWCGREYEILHTAAIDRFCVTASSSSSSSSSEEEQEESEMYFINMQFLERLRLEYSVDWPLNIIINSSVLDMLNSIMRLFLCIKYAENVLDDIHVPRRNSSSGGAAEGTGGQQQVFHKIGMMINEFRFFIRNLQTYLLTKIHIGEWPNLLKSLEKAGNFDEIKGAVEAGVLRIFDLCFLREKFVLRGVKKILNLAIKFQRKVNLFVTKYSSSFTSPPSVVAVAPINPQEFTLEQFSKREAHVQKMKIEMETIGISFRSNMNSLLTVLNGFLNKGRHPELEDLMMKLTYNNYYSV